MIGTPNYAWKDFFFSLKYKNHAQQLLGHAKIKALGPVCLSGYRLPTPGEELLSAREKEMNTGLLRDACVGLWVDPAHYVAACQCGGIMARWWMESQFTFITLKAKEVIL